LHTDWPSATAPSQPQPPTGTATPTTIELRWNNPPTDDGGAQILEFIVALSLNENHAPVVLFHNYTQRHLFEHLPANSTYCFVVAAQNSRGAGPYSERACITTRNASPPQAPSLQLLSTGADRIGVQWNAPNDNGASIDAYQLEADNWWTNSSFAQVFQGNAFNYTHVNLLPASRYSFRLRAQNSIGYSNWSVSQSYQTNERGSCGNPSDILIERQKFDVVKSTIQQCLMSCVVSGEQCAIQCIQTALGFSHGCATCFGDLGVCTLSNCAVACIRPSSQACADCARQYCFPNAVACTGFPIWALPP
jgi:hypothetical protein